MLSISTHVIDAQLSEACPDDRKVYPDVNPNSTLLESASSSPIVLRPEGVRSVLHLSQNLAARTPGEVLRRSVAKGRLILLLCDLRAAQTPETLFHVYLNLPERADQATRAHHLLAQFNFFGAIPPGDPTMPVWQSFDITHVVGTLAEQGVLKTEPVLTIASARTFDPLSRPSVGRIAIVQQ